MINALKFNYAKRCLSSLFCFCTAIICLYAQPGSLDLSFDPGLGANRAISAIAVQPDGKILIAGAFTKYNGSPINGIARLHADGNLDKGFNPKLGDDNAINAIAVQPDGKILIGGSFENGDSSILRLNTDGSRDSSFSTMAAENSSVHSIALQPDGKILIGGAFAQYNGISRINIARLNADGSLDLSFNPGSGTNGAVYAVVLHTDGKILIGGGFNRYNGTLVGHRIARLNTDGSLDQAFHQLTGSGLSANINAITLQSDKEILVGGAFSCYENRQGGNHLARLHANGIYDDKFNDTFQGGANEGVYNGWVHAIAVQPDGKILIGGVFQKYNEIVRPGIARLNTDGSLDKSFDPGSGINVNQGPITAIVLQSDGKILIGGAFNRYNGAKRNNIARLNNDLKAMASSNQTEQVVSTNFAADPSKSKPGTHAQIKTEAQPSNLNDEMELQAFTRRFMAAYNAQDHVALGKMYSEDALRIDQDGKQIKGSENIAAFFAEQFRNNNSTLLLRHKGVSWSDAEHAWVIKGNYEVYGNTYVYDIPIETAGTYANAMQKKNGAWRIVKSHLFPLDLTRVKEDIQDLETRLSAAIRARDLETLMSFYAEEAIVMPDGKPKLAGKAAIRKDKEKMLARTRKNSVVSTETQELFGNENSVTEIGKTSIKDPSGEIIYAGSYVVVWEKRKGQWMLVREITREDHRK